MLHCSLTVCLDCHSFFFFSIGFSSDYFPTIFFIVILTDAQPRTNKRGSRLLTCNGTEKLGRDP